MSRHARPPRYHLRVAGATVVALPLVVLLGINMSDGTTSVADAIADLPSQSPRSSDHEPTATAVPTTSSPSSVADSPAVSSSSRRTDPGRPEDRAGPTTGGPTEDARPTATPEPSDVAGAEPDPDPVEPQPDPSIALDVPEITNLERLAYGCGPVALDPTLQAYAEANSAAQAQDGFMHHGEGPTGFAGWGENVASGQTTAQEVHDAWMASEGHRDNILNCDYTLVGVAVVEGYWTMVLAY